MMRNGCKLASAALILAFSQSPSLQAADDGVVRVKSAYSMPETIQRLKEDIATKGITTTMTCTRTTSVVTGSSILFHGFETTRSCQ